MTTVPIPVSEGEDVEAPLTWGQRKIQRELLAYPDDLYLAFLPVTIPAHGSTVDGVVAALASVLAESESLRTIYPGADLQRVLGSPGYELELIENGTAEAIHADMMSSRFRPTDLPVRLALILRDGVPEEIVAVLTHMAVDGIALEFFTSRVADALAGELLPWQAWQPRQLARAQRSPEGLARNARTLSWWEAKYRTAPAAVFPTPVDAPGDPRYIEARMLSFGAATALRALTRRTRVSPSMVALAGLCTILGEHSGQSRIAVSSLSANRSSAQTLRMMGTLSQDALIVVDTPQPFDDLTSQIWESATSAYTHSTVDPDEQQLVREKTDAARGTPFLRDVVYNDVSSPSIFGQPAPPHSPATGTTTITVAPSEFMFVSAYATVYRMDSVFEVSLWADTAYLPEPTVVDLLNAWEQALVAAAR
ncbi:condensation domain-containing protein [Actinokineospora diospyrosa]|uniref:Condensation domain-containing protein n=1 Tax=Actinokineospora diospyrosa TaxID=103728 RepID=A0ABT1IMJ8_9PSEU|nr:condensation domain-containing protein [Actinokineospora diospyrosa]MCP2273894.1 Condensation domain-containing protein [Actinokineospora diospyrosa]